MTAGVHCLFFQNPLIRASLHPGTDFSNSQELVEALGEIVANQSDILVQVSIIYITVNANYALQLTILVLKLMLRFRVLFQYAFVAQLCCTNQKASSKNSSEDIEGFFRRALALYASFQKMVQLRFRIFRSLFRPSAFAFRSYTFAFVTEFRTSDGKVSKSGINFKDTYCVPYLAGKLKGQALRLANCITQPARQGTCESQNAGARNGSKMRAVRCHHRTRRASLFTGLVGWTGLNWSGLDSP